MLGAVLHSMPPCPPRAASHTTSRITTTDDANNGTARIFASLADLPARCKIVIAQSPCGPYDALMEALQLAVAAGITSPDPTADAKENLAAFVPLVGSWDLAYTFRRGTGKYLEGTGYAHFAWGLGGTAIVDIFGFDTGQVGTTIRFYDPAIDAFRSTWICPIRNALIPFIGRAIDGRIVLDAVPRDPAGRRLRWSFVTIEAERFSWRGEASDDDGRTWLLLQTIEGTRSTIRT